MMSLKSVALAGLSCLLLAACETLPIELQGQDRNTQPAPTASSQGADPAPASQVDPQDGIVGAALCVSAAYYLADAGLMSEDDATAYADVWIRILEVIPAESEDGRQRAVDDAYAAFTTLDQRGNDEGLIGARGQYTDGGRCGDDEFQRAFLARYGDPTLMQQRLQGG